MRFNNTDFIVRRASVYSGKSREVFLEMRLKVPVEDVIFIILYAI